MGCRGRGGVGLGVGIQEDDERARWGGHAWYCGHAKRRGSTGPLMAEDALEHIFFCLFLERLERDGMGQVDSSIINQRDRMG
jgi:hypothetical protein